MKQLNELESSNNSKRRRARRKGIQVKVGNTVIKIYVDADAGEGRRPYRVLWTGADGDIHREMFATLDDARTFAETTAHNLNNGQRPYTRAEIDRLFELDARVKLWAKQLADLNRTIEQVIADVLATHQVLPDWTLLQMAHEIRRRHSTIRQYLKIDEASPCFLKHLRSGFRRQYSRSYLCQQTKYCREFAARHAGRRMDLVLPQEVLDFVNNYRVQPNYKHKGMSPGTDGLMAADAKTKESVYNCLRRFFQFARDVLCALPAEERTAAERVERPQVPRNKPAVYLPCEIAAMLGGMPDVELLLFGAVQVFAGLRGCEAIQLEGEDFKRDDDGNWITIFVRYGKRSPQGDGAHRIRRAPITPPLAALLKQLSLPKGRLFKRYRLARYFTEFARLAGISWKHDALRHTFVTYRLLQVKDRGLVAMEAGHTVAVQMDHYEGLVDPAHVKAFWSFVPNAATLPWQARIPDVKTLIRRGAQMHQNPGQEQGDVCTQA